MKHFFRLLIAAAVLATSVAACGVYEVSIEPYANQYWNGKSHAEIVSVYGAPDREVSDGLGGKIIIYEQKQTTVNAYGDGPYYGGFYGFYYHMSSPVNAQVTTEIEYAHFYIGGDGVCYKVSTNLTKSVDRKEYNEKYKQDPKRK
ncbi:MAG: hypothetical protein MJY45_06300 [Bacteroidales bacterium]|nr:hypothetical protein [Bacteroidales bacterium]